MPRVIGVSGSNTKNSASHYRMVFGCWKYSNNVQEEGLGVVSKYIYKKKYSVMVQNILNTIRFEMVKKVWQKKQNAEKIEHFPGLFQAYLFCSSFLKSHIFEQVQKHFFTNFSANVLS